MFILFLLCCLEFVHASLVTTQFTDSYYIGSDQKRYELKLPWAQQAMRYWSEKYHFSNGDYAFYDKPSNIESKMFSCSAYFSLYEEQVVNDLISLKFAPTQERYAFLCNFGATHAFVLLYTKTKHGDALISIDTCGSDSKLLRLLHLKTDIPVYYNNVRLQYDNYSCYLATCLFAKEFLAKDSNGRWRMSDVSTFLERWSEPRDPYQDLYGEQCFILKKLPPSFLKGCQLIKSYILLIEPNAVITTKNGKLQKLSEWQKKHMAFDMMLEMETNRYWHKKAIKLFKKL